MFLGSVCEPKFSADQFVIQNSILNKSAKKMLTVTEEFSFSFQVFEIRSIEDMTEEWLIEKLKFFR